MKRGYLDAAAMNNDLVDPLVPFLPPDATSIDAFRLGEGTPCKDLAVAEERSLENAETRR